MSEKPGLAQTTKKHPEENQIRRMRLSKPARAILTLLLLVHAGDVSAEEGMWPPALMPLARMEQSVGAKLDKAFLERLQLATLQFSGATAFFVSPAGLVLTNHHVGLRCIQTVSTVGANHYVSGFIAGKRADELRCPSQEARVLMSYTDITEEVVRVGLKQPVNRAAAEAQAQSEIENRCGRETGLVCEVVSLSGGARRFLYRYRKYDDVRLVAAPEIQVAYFGGDPDNFEYPRYYIDVALFRIYDKGSPVTPPAHLKPAQPGVAEGDAVIVSGHPRRTNRGLPVPQLEVLRDVTLPLWVRAYERRIRLLEQYRKGSAERIRRSANFIFGARNGHKRDSGYLAALRLPDTLAAQQGKFDRLAAALPDDAANLRLSGLLAAAAQLAAKERRFVVEDYYVSHITGSRLFEWAVLLTRWADQTAMPEGSRLEGFRGARLTSTESWITSETPVFSDLETVMLADRWIEAAEALGVSHPYARALSGVDAAALVNGTGLADPALRKSLLSAGAQAIRESADPLLVLARRLELHLYGVRMRYEKDIKEPTEQLQQSLVQLRAAVHGSGDAPDADGSLRFAFGRVAGYREGTVEQPWATTLGGMYERAEKANYRAPENLPRAWRERRDRLPMRTPSNFVSTLDHSGGNSGSPIVNARGDWVGVLHDGNRQYLGTQYVYSSEQARTIATHADAIMVWLGTVHDSRELITEIAGR